MGTILLIIANLFVYNTWIWFANKLLKFHKKKLPIIVGLAVSGVVSAAVMLGYHPLLESINFTQAGFAGMATEASFVTYALYLAAMLYVVYTFTAHIRKREYIQGGIFLLIWIVVSVLGSLGILKGIALYYMFIAFGEELLKYELGNILYQRYQINIRDIIIFSILSALGFAIVENLVYLANSSSRESLGGANKLLLQRGLLTASVHAVFTGIIGYGIMYAQLFKQNIALPLAILGGIIMHWLYNLTMFYNILILMPILIVGSYLLLSFLTFQTDTLYKQEI